MNSTQMLSQQPASRLDKLAESQTLAMARRSREMTAQGIDVVNLSIGEPDFETPGFIKEAACEAIHNNITHYTPVPGFAELRAAVARKFERDNGLSYKPEQIVVSTGAKQSIANVILSLLNEGEEVLIPVPYWVSYLELIKLADGVPVFVPSTVHDNFKVKPEALRKALTAKTRMLIFSSPCNPSGSVYSREELQALADVLADFPNVLVVSDEIYEHINYLGAHCSMASIPGMMDRTVTVNGVSKGFAMTGWRIGYIGAPLWIAKACEKMQGQFTSGTCSVSQMAALAAVNADPIVVEPMRESFLQRRNLVVELLSKIPGIKCNVPDGAFYVFPDITHYFGKAKGERVIRNSSDFAMYLLDEAHVAVVSGDAFGDDNCFRFSYACSEAQIRKAIERMSAALAQLN